MEVPTETTAETAPGEVPAADASVEIAAEAA